MVSHFTPTPNEPTQQDNMIGLVSEIVIDGINSSNPIECKIDTGADVCSLHAEDIEIVGHEELAKVVKFTFNNMRYSIPIEGFQSVVSASGTSIRPLVVLDVRINDIKVEGVQFNLTDRSDMDHKVLVGCNLIEAAKLIIDPSITEDVLPGNSPDDVSISAPPVDISALTVTSTDPESPTTVIEWLSKNPGIVDKLRNLLDIIENHQMGDSSDKDAKITIPDN